MSGPLQRDCILCMLYRLLPAKTSRRNSQRILPRRSTASRLLSITFGISSLDKLVTQQDASQFLEQLLQQLHGQTGIIHGRKDSGLTGLFAGLRLDAISCPHCTSQSSKPYTECPAMIRLPFIHGESIETALRRYAAAEDLSGGDAKRRKCDM
jgi:uncharacterized UBP type Zn finger protein